MPNKDLQKEFHDLFMLYDRDNDGYLNKNEFFSIMKSLELKITNKEIDDMIKDYIDESGNLPKESFIIILNDKMKSVNTYDEIIESFRVFDRENNGFITVKEMKRLFIMFNTLLSESEYANLMDKAASLTDDGNIDYKKFCTMILERN